MMQILVVLLSLFELEDYCEDDPFDRKKYLKGAQKKCPPPKEAGGYGEQQEEA
jgi:hypothetical protein